MNWFRTGKYQGWLAIATLSIVIFWHSVACSAEIIRFNYGLLGFRVAVADLVNFANSGKISRSLNFYLQRIDLKQQQEFRRFLNQSYDVDPILVYRYSRTSVGVELLKRIGDIIQLPGKLNGFYGLRAAVVQTAFSEKGISFINFLETFPTNIQLNLREIINLVKQISQNEQEIQDFIRDIPEISSNKSRSNLKQLPEFSQPGQYQTSYQTLELYDHQRQRLLNTDLYLPQTKTKNIPVIIISNGLGAKRDRFEELARHLSSYGFAVVIPDHPGSDRARQKAFLQGLYQENFDATDYIDRPKDISYILDELTVLNQKQFNSQLNLDKIGIFGYSIGGTTALSLAGAKISPQHLQRECAQPLELFNISTLYQCRALELSVDQPSLQDKRIKAAFLFVPFGNSIYSQQGLKQVAIPMMWQVVDRDFLTSLLTEQLPLFNNLTESDRYLVISEKIPHSNVTLSKEQQTEQGKIFQIAKNYQNILSLVFFQNYIAQNSDYQPYLSPEFMQAITTDPYELHLVRGRVKSK